VIGIVDGDEVDFSNLHRQILHTEERVGQYKVDSAKLALEQFVDILKAQYPQSMTTYLQDQLFYQSGSLQRGVDSPKCQRYHNSI
jgi:adenylyltransferase/sulfurtransferase